MVKAADRDSTGQLIPEANSRREENLSGIRQGGDLNGGTEMKNCLKHSTGALRQAEPDLRTDMRSANLRPQIIQEVIMMMKCSFGKGITIKPDGVNELDPCSYKTVEVHRNVTVKVLRCQRCGHMDLEWLRQDDTEDLDVDEED